MTMLSTEALRQQWLKICLDKFNACRNDKRVLINALNERQSLNKKMTLDNMDEIFAAMDTGDRAMFHESDLVRIGNILRSCFEDDQTFVDRLKSKLRFSEIFQLEAAIFYSFGDRFYMLSDKSDALQDSQVYIKKIDLNDEDSPDQYSLFYSVVTRGQLFTDYIHEDEVKVLQDSSLTFDSDFSSVLLCLPEILKLIARKNPDHIDLEVANSHMQYYTSWMSECIDEGDLVNAQADKNNFIDIAGKAIGQKVAHTLYHNVLYKLLEVYDPGLFEDQDDVVQNLQNQDLETLSVVELKEKIRVMLDLTDEFHMRIAQCYDEFERERQLLASISFEDLPVLLKQESQRLLTQMEEIRANNPQPLVVYQVSRWMSRFHQSVQQEMKNTRLRVSENAEKLTQFLASPGLIPPGYKTKIESLLSSSQGMLSFASAKKTEQEMRNLISEMHQLMKQHHEAYMSVVRELNDVLLSAADPVQYQALQRKLHADLNSKDAYDWDSIAEKTAYYEAQRALIHQQEQHQKAQQQESFDTSVAALRHVTHFLGTTVVGAWEAAFASVADTTGSQPPEIACNK